MEERPQQRASSFSPDGSTLALTKSDDNLDGPRVTLVHLPDGGRQDLVRLGEEPAFSPDGSQLAFVGYLSKDVVETEESHDYSAGDLYVVDTAGTQVRRLTRTDDVIESSPSWDPSGQRIGYVQIMADTSFVPVFGLLFPVGDALMQINPDGSCRQKIASERKVAFYGVAWQPGSGREAGRIEC